jgi:3-hydroxyisobutyrate dehydrogenase
MPENDNAKTTVAVLGVGRMGAPMAARLIAAGFAVRIWNRSPQRVLPLVEAGAVGTSSPAEAATGADLLITMLPDGPAVEAVMLGSEGALGAMSKGAIWLQMSSVGVEWSDRLGQLVAAGAVSYVDAPVSGSVGPAEAGTLLVLASGPDDVHAAVAPVFNAMGRQTLWLGAAGAGSKAKLVLNNWLVDLVESTAETLRFSQVLGLDPAVIVDILDGGPLGSPYAVAKARQMLAGDFGPGFALKHAVKDADLSVAAARTAGLTLGLTDSLVPSWHGAMANGSGEQDLAVVYQTAG